MVSFVLSFKWLLVLLNSKQIKHEFLSKNNYKSEQANGTCTALKDSLNLKLFDHSNVQHDLFKA